MSTTDARATQAFILPTSDIVENFHQQTGRVFEPQILEIFNQIFDLMDKQSPLDMRGGMVLDWMNLSDVQIDGTVANAAAYQLMVKTYQVLMMHGMVNDRSALTYFPYLMVGSDLCVSYYVN